MASVSRTSSSVGMQPEYDHETQLCSSTRSEDCVDRYPWVSRGRRLFPQRRPSIPSFASHNVTTIPGLPPFDTSPSRDHSPIDHQESDSNTSSPSSVDSVGTVEIHMSPTPDRPFPETDPTVGEDACVRRPYLARSLSRSCSVERSITPRISTNRSLETSFSAPLYTDTPARGNLQWKSMAHFHRTGRRLRPRTPLKLQNCEKTPHASQKNEDGFVPTVDTVIGDPPFIMVPCQWSQGSQSPELTANPGVNPIEVHQGWGRGEDTSVVTKDQSHPGVPALEIANWDCTVKLSTVATVADNGRLHVHHLALLSVIMPMEELYAEKAGLSFVVANALRNDHKHSLGPGQSSLLFKEDVSQSRFFPREGAELIIVRDSCDLEKPLNLHFAFTYASPCHFVMVSLPTFRPKEGRSLSDVVFIAEPLPPLSMRTFIRDPLSSWKLCHHPVSQFTCYERIDPTQLYPADFQDDIQLRLLELDTVRFRALAESALSSVIWKLDITVYELLGEQVECRLSFFLEVGAAAALVSLVPHGWVPRYFIADGHVATEKVGESWKNKKGHIKIYWQGTPNIDNVDGYSTDAPLLPRIADRKVLGGRLTCRPDERVVLLNHLEERIRTYGSVDGTYALLPIMDAGYRIHLEHVSEERSPISRSSVSIRPPFLPIPEYTQLSEHTIFHSDAELKLNHERGWSHTANNVKGEAIAKHVLRALLLPLTILLLLVPGFLLSVEHVRNGNYHSERTSWRDQDPFIKSRDGERPQVAIDIAGLGSLQPVAASEKHGNKVEKCDGWRDWIDVYVGGWKGCTM